MKIEEEKKSRRNYFARLFDALRIGYHHAEALRHHRLGDYKEGFRHFCKMNNLVARRIEEKRAG